MSRFVLGARHACTRCSTRSVHELCACRRGAEPLDLLAASDAEIRRALAGPLEPLRPSDIVTHLVGSKLEVGLTLLVVGAAILADGATLRDPPIVVVLVVAMMLLTARFVVLVVVLAFRIAFALVVVPIALLGGLVARRVGASDAVARDAVDLVFRVLTFARGPSRTVRLLLPEPPAGGASFAGEVLGALSLVTVRGSLGRAERADARLAPFSLVLPSGERLDVVPTVGTIELEKVPTSLGEPIQLPDTPLFDGARSVTVALPKVWVHVRGGALETATCRSAAPSAYRAPPAVRRLVGTAEAPLALVLSVSAGA